MPPTCAAQSYGGPANPGQPGPPGHGAGSGPTDGAGDDPVNLATGVDTYHQAPDISVYNSTGVSASFQRTAYSNLALSGNAAPGLSTGWSHNYNVQILGVGQTATWLPVTLIYADGVTEQLTPVLDASGNPTGAFTPPAGSPFIVRGVASGTTGVWSSITLTWDDQTQWAFNGGTTTANGISVYPLTQITNRVGQALLLAWDGYRKLQSVTDRATGRTLLSFTYDGAGYLSSVTDPINGASARQVNYTFGNDSASGATVLKSVSQVTTVGNTSAPARATYGYVAGPGTNTGGHLPLLSTVTVPSPTGVGNTTDTVAYDSGFRVKSYTDMNGFQHLYTYNKGNTFVQLRDGNGVAAVTWTTRFDTLNRINGVKDAAGNNTSIGYADLGNPLQPTIISDKNLHAYQYTYDAFGHPVKIKDPRGVETTFTWAYNQFALGRLQKVQVGTNQGTPRTPTTFAYYEPSGLVQTITGPAPNSSAGGATVVQASMTYDPLGDLLTLRHPGNNATVSGGTDQGVTLTFNYANDPQVTVTDAQNVARTIPGASQPAASVGHPLSIQNSATGQISHLRYGARGLLQTTYDALGHEGDLTYNLADQVTSVILPHTGQTSQDGLGQARVVTTYQYPGGPAASQQVFDESGASTPFRQAVSHYGPEGEIISITATDNTTLATYAYDAAYRLKTLTDGGGHVTRYYYNPVGYLSAILYPGGDTFQIPSYDPAGNALQAIDGRGVVTNYVYSDPASALTDVKYPATPAKNVHYDYDVYGRLIDTTDGGYGAFNADGTVKTVGKAFSYYENGQFSSAQVALRKPDGTTLPAKTLSAVYWPDGSLQTMTTPAGVFSYNYDGAGRLLNLTNPFSEQTAWQYQANGWPLQTAFANGVKAGYQFNPIGQILGLTYKNSAGTTIADLSIPAFGGYDGAGNRLSQTVTIPAAGLPAGYSGPATYFSGTTNYQYDPRNQLLLESSSRLGSSPLTTNYSYGYGYDSAGNPTKFRNVTVGGVGFNANNQSTASGFAFDAAGNPVSYFGLPLAFDAENHLLTTGH